MKKEKILLPEDTSHAHIPWLWIGTWSMGGEGFGSYNGRESLYVLSNAVESGIRHFDTAGFYAHGRSEALLKKIVKSSRKEFFISTKGGLVWKGKRVEHCGSLKGLEEQLTKSLERLHTDYIDLYQLHWPDPNIPVEESIDALKELQAQGLIRYWGVGNLLEDQIKMYLHHEKNIPHQVHFNPVHKKQGLLDAGRSACMNCIISPLEQGLLGSGKSSIGKEGIGKKDLRNKNPYFADSNVRQWNKKLTALAQHYRVSKVSLVLMWICMQPHVHAIIPGPRTVEQMAEIEEFRKAVEDGDLCASAQSDAILMGSKIKNMVPDELWEHLDTGPQHN